MSCCDGGMVMKGFSLEYTALIGTILAQFVANFISYYGRFFNTGYTFVLIACTFAIPAVRTNYADRCFGIVASVFATISSVTFFIVSIICLVIISATSLSSDPTTISQSSSDSSSVTYYYTPVYDNTNFSSIGGLMITLFCVFEFLVSTLLAIKHITNCCRAKRLFQNNVNQGHTVSTYTNMTQPFMQQGMYNLGREERGQDVGFTA